jgi:hypothetical protein
VTAVGEKASFVAHAIRAAAAEHTEQPRGWDPYPADDPAWHLNGAADVLQQAWREQPASAAQVILGPGFDLLADPMAKAERPGLDAGALLGTIDPEKIAAADGPSPAGITSTALSRAASDAQIPTWTEREYGHLTDETLAGELEHAREQLDAAIAEQTAATQEAALLAEAVAAGRGPAVTRLEQELAELDRTAVELARHSAIETDWRNAAQAAQSAAVEAAKTEIDRDRHSTRGHRRRAALDSRISELRQQEAGANATAAAAADLARTLKRVPRDRVERARIAKRIAQMDANRNQLLAAAKAEDIEFVHHQAMQEGVHPARRHVDQLDLESRTRSQFSAQRRTREGVERDAAGEVGLPAGTAPGISQPPDLALSVQPHIDPPAPVTPLVQRTL